jgi:hypothetical protein
MVNLNVVFASAVIVVCINSITVPVGHLYINISVLYQLLLQM